MQPRITTRNAIRGTFTATPRLTAEIVRCDDSIVPGVPVAIGTLLLKDIASHVIVPVQRRLRTTQLLQETAAEWDRHLVVDLELGSPCFHPPVLLSSRNNWHLDQSKVEVFDRAIVVDGAKRLEAAFTYESIGTVPVVVLMGLDSNEEIQLRKRIQLSHASTLHVETLERVGTTAPRLKIDQTWVKLEVQSDPFVVTTTRGYAPAILVRRERCSHLEHVLIGAKSLALELNALRQRRGTLRGYRISIRKQSAQRTAPYILHVDEDTVE